MKTVSVFATTLAFLIIAHSAAQAASPSVELKRIFSKMDRDLCRSLSLATCKRVAAHKKRKPKAVKHVKPEQRKVQPVKPGEIERKAEKEIIPLPVLKPAVVTKEEAPPVLPKVIMTQPVPKPPDVKVVVLPTPAVPAPQVLPQLPHGMPDGTLQGEACFDGLAKLGVDFSRLTTAVGTGVCSVSDAVEMRSLSIAGNIVILPDRPTLNCGFATKFANWIRQEASPIVMNATQNNIAAIGTGPGFQCRGRNGDSSGKISEHGFGNAVDIERVKLTDGAFIEVKDAMTIGAKYQPVLATLRVSSCQYFTTVLGPGANSAHATHFHFDLERRGKAGNHAMCQ